MARAEDRFKRHPTEEVRAVARRRPRRLRRWVARRWGRLLESSWLFLAGFLVAGAASLLPWSALFAPRIEAGAIAGRDFIAPRDLLLPDDESTLARQQKARDEVLPVYDFDPRPEVAGRLGELFAAGRALLPGEGAARLRGDPATPARVEALVPATTLKITPGQAALLLRTGLTPELEDRVRGLASQVARRGVALGKSELLENRLRGISLRNLATGFEAPSLDLYDYLGYPDEVRDQVETEVRAWPGLSGSEGRLLALFLTTNLGPNLHFNQSETLLRQEAAALAAPPSFTRVRQGQVIARKGDQLDPAAVRVIGSYQSADAPSWWQSLQLAGVLALLAGAAFVAWLSLASERVEHRSRRRLWSESLLLLGASLVLARLGLVIAEALAGSFDGPPLTSARAFTFAVPFATLGLLAALLFGRARALTLAPVFSLLVAWLAGAEGLWMALLALAGNLAAIYSLDPYQVKQRLVMTRSGVVVGAVNAGLVLVLRALGQGWSGGLVQVSFELVCAVAGGLLAAAIASFALPLFEAAYGLATDIKLAELANTNLPLLRRLAYEAPGTFQHSLMVANLAKQASEEIGADAPLAYTAGLYHDVGKLLRPDYFVENQRPGANPHDKLQPTMSALILVNHIKDGRELAREHHLPQALVDAIEQHHGTRLIKYFYGRAAAQRERGTGELPEEAFRYPGPRPQSKVMGVLMLADAVEAASRTLVDLTVPKVRTLIRTIVEDCLQDRQLDETDLTLADLARVSESFLRVLTTIFHQRVDYPGFDFNAEPREKRPAKVIPLAQVRP